MQRTLEKNWNYSIKKNYISTNYMKAKINRTQMYSEYHQFPWRNIYRIENENSENVIRKKEDNIG